MKIQMKKMKIKFEALRNIPFGEYISWCITELHAYIQRAYWNIAVKLQDSEYLRVQHQITA